PVHRDAIAVPGQYGIAHLAHGGALHLVVEPGRSRSVYDHERREPTIAGIVRPKDYVVAPVRAPELPRRLEQLEELADGRPLVSPRHDADHLSTCRIPSRRPLTRATPTPRRGERPAPPGAAAPRSIGERGRPPAHVSRPP